MPPDIEERGDGSEKYGGKILGQELWYQGRNGPMFLLVLGLLAAIGVLVWLQDQRNTERALKLQIEHQSIVRAMQANETQNRIGNWLMSINPEKRPQLSMPPEAWGLLSDEAKKKMADEYTNEYERRRR